MSVAISRWGLSNIALKPWVITVIVIVLITWKTLGEAVGLYADTLAVTTALFAHRAEQRRAALPVHQQRVGRAGQRHGR
ncbi:hypothetical protein [Streptomyces sp. NBC_01518]|uniref:hypothetical protein n=1 Tax=Streptomyces sp. NBC_01518 TaxID=2903891 RepID=UPI00386DF421